MDFCKPCDYIRTIKYANRYMPDKVAYVVKCSHERNNRWRAETYPRFTFGLCSPYHTPKISLASEGYFLAYSAKRLHFHLFLFCFHIWFNGTIW